MEWLKLVHGAAAPPKAKFGPGDDIRVWYRILEHGKERLGQFEGTVIRCRGAGFSKSFTVRRVTYGEGVERSFPMDAKIISRIEVLRQGRVKRARLYFLRHVIGKTRIAAAEAKASAQQPAETVPVVHAPPTPTAPEKTSASAEQPADRAASA